MEGCSCLKKFFFIEFHCLETALLKIRDGLVRIFGEENSVLLGALGKGFVRKGICRRFQQRLDWEDNRHLIFTLFNACFILVFFRLRGVTDLTNISSSISAPSYSRGRLILKKRENFLVNNRRKMKLKNLKLNKYLNNKKKLEIF